MIYKCKMCGGSLEIKDNETIAVCDYCGTKQTLPRLDNEKKIGLFDRANYFRRNNEYDRAMLIYEQILADEKNDSEVYWSIVLCRYGIEYVEDPLTHNRIPTVNRVQYNSILNDEDYKKALELADSNQRELYIEEANKINNIQKGILEVSSKEEPFDIFICYKETDENGRRTEDSVIAQNIYKELTNEGYKVFFSRITLEDKIGTAYEPYIFAALNSAKVMLVIGTKLEHFNAVWVKNEWSRYLSLINKGQKKVLIPCYKNMDPYDLPEEFAYLQAQDLNKLGFIQDLTRGIEKIFSKRNTISFDDNIINTTNPNDRTDNLIIKMNDLLTRKKFTRAEEYAERILDIEPNCLEAYKGLFLANYHCSNLTEVGLLSININNDNTFKNLYLIADIELKNTLDKLLNKIKTNISRKRKKKRILIIVLCIILPLCIAASFGVSKIIKEKEYNNEMLAKEESYNEAILILNENPQNAKLVFTELGDYKDSLFYSILCDGVDRLNNGETYDALKIFESIKDVEKADSYIKKCKNKLIDDFDDVDYFKENYTNYKKQTYIPDIYKLFFSSSTELVFYDNVNREKYVISGVEVSFSGISNIIVEKGNLDIVDINSSSTRKNKIIMINLDTGKIEIYKENRFITYDVYLACSSPKRIILVDTDSKNILLLSSKKND